MMACAEHELKLSIHQGLTQFERSIAGSFELCAKHYPHSLETYVILNPGRITNIAKILLTAVGGEPRAATESPSPMLSKCTRALELLGKHVSRLDILPEAEQPLGRETFHSFLREKLPLSLQEPFRLPTASPLGPPSLYTFRGMYTSTIKP